MATKTTATFEEAYNRLNKGQKQAVDTVDGPVMVLAGPGTGKTQTLTVRIGHILQQTQLDPWNILCLTFTESAATEMRQRLAGMIGSAAYQVHISTFHSFCNSVIQDHPEIFALSSDWQPLTDVERVKVVQEILDSLPGTSALKPFGAPYLYLRDCVGHIQTLKQEDISPKQFKEILNHLSGFVKEVSGAVQAFADKKANDRTNEDCDAILSVLKDAAQKHAVPALLTQQLSEIEEQFSMMLDVAEGKREAGKARTKCKNDVKRIVSRIENNIPRWQELQKVYDAYGKRLIETGRYDFEDMIILVVQKFKENKDLLADYQEQFQYILVDEFQDTNGAQNEIVALLGSYDETPNIFVVGDDKQSIYRFQGASLANMLSFYERYKEHVSVISLTDNYRSQPVVLDVAASVISKSKFLLSDMIPGISATLDAKSGIPAQTVTQYIAESPGAEVAIVAREISALLEKSVDPSEIAVLVRYNRDAMEVAQALRQHAVPATLAAGENALQQPVIEQWLSVWRYLSNPHEYEYLLSDIIRFNWWKIDALDALRAIRGAADARVSLTTAFADVTLLQSAGVKDSEKITSFMQQLGSWYSLAANTTVSNFLVTLLEESGWLAAVQKNTEGLVQLEHMSTVLAQVKEADTHGNHLSLKDFIELLEMHIRHDVPLITPERRLGKHTVTVMTAHKAKGLEFEHVFIPRFVDKSWGGGRTPYRLPLPDGLVKGDVVAEGEQEEDERRLLYVALTRAKRSITISRSVVNVADKPNTPSLYLHEFPDGALKDVKEEESEEGAAERLVVAELKPPSYTRDLESWVRSLLEGYVLSVTHLNHYLEDPKLFYTRHVLRIPSVRSFYQAMGTAAHNALNDFFFQFHEGKELPTKKYLLNRFEHYLQREALTSQEYEDVLAVGNEQLGAYFDFYQNQFVDNTLGEYDFRSHNVRIDGVPITGKIDKIEILEHKQVNVVDYKTGSPERGLTKLKPGEDYHRQIVFYKLLAEHSPQFDYEMVSGEVDFIRPNRAGKFVKKKVEVTPKDTEDLKNTIKRVWEEIQELKFLE